MDTLLLGITVVSLVVALVMSVSAWRLSHEEKRRAAARVAALSVAASTSEGFGGHGRAASAAQTEDEPRRAPWAPAFGTPHVGPSKVPPYESAGMPRHEDAGLGGVTPYGNAGSGGTDVLHYNEPASAVSDVRPFLGAASTTHGSDGRQRSLAVAAAVLFVGLSLGVVWTMSGPRGTTPRAMGPNNPLELISLRHERQATKLAISGLVRNPVSGQPVEHLSVVVFLFDQAGAFLTSSRTPVDFVQLGVGDESPFVVTLDAPANVARYRVSFRTDAGIVPHIDRRGAPPVAQTGEQAVSVTLK